jgi:hypothetical protein
MNITVNHAKARTRPFTAQKKLAVHAHAANPLKFQRLFLLSTGEKILKKKLLLVKG